MKKEVIKQAVDQYLPELVKIADEIYDLAEPGMEADVRDRRALSVLYFISIRSCSCGCSEGRNEDRV